MLINSQPIPYKNTGDNIMSLMTNFTPDSTETKVTAKLCTSSLLMNWFVKQI